MDHYGESLFASSTNTSTIFGRTNIVEGQVKANVTIGEVSDIFRQAWGEHRDAAYL